MGTFAREQKPAQRTNIAGSMTRRCAFSSQSERVNSPFHLQRPGANQPAQGLLNENTGDWGMPGSTRFGHDFSQIPLYPAPVPAVSQLPGLLLQRTCTCGAHTVASGGCSECDKKKNTLQRKASSSATANDVPPIVHQVLGSPGQPLDDATRALMEPRFGHDFSRVRVHTDTAAAESAREVNALAYAVGRNVVFGAGQFAPGTSSGQQLLAHELTHVVQQSRFQASQPLSIGPTNDAYEQSAERTAEAVMGHQPSHGPVVAEQASPVSIQRVSFGNDGELSPARKAIVRKAGEIAERRVMGGGGNYSFHKQWEAFWKGPGAQITPKPTLEAYQQAVKGRVVHDMETSKRKDVSDFVKDEKDVTLERKTAAVTKVGEMDTFMRGFAIDQGVDSVVSLLLHESLHGAGLPMGPAELFEPFFHQLEADVGFPLMMGGGTIVKIDQKRRGDTDVDVTVTYSLHKIDIAEIPAKIEVQIVSPESGEVVFDEQADGSRKPAREVIPSRAGQRTWLWHARNPGFASYNVRLRDMTSESLLASQDFRPNPRCVIGVSTKHCEDD